MLCKAPWAVGILAAGACVAGLAVATVSAQDTPAPPLSLVLSRAARYVEKFAARISGFVTEESYVQDVALPIDRFGARPNGRSYSGPMHRELKSDLLLVRPIGTDAWLQFRDVTEVDGRKMRDRNDRLAKLFLDPSKSTAAQSKKIMEESARYNIGDIERNINLPVLALAVLDRGLQAGFEFTLDKPGEKYDLPNSAAFAPPPNALVVSFRETQLRTMVASPQGKNLPASGHFWLDPATSQVEMTEIGIEDSWLRAVIHVAYGNVEGIDLPVPIEMHERYDNKLNGTRVDGSATYANFREFKVSVDEDIAVKVFPATDAGATISFNQLHEACRTRIQQKRWCPTCQRDVANTDIVKGYEFEKGHWVVIDDEDIDKVRVESTRVINLEKFTDDVEIDPIYLDKPYYLAPDGPVAKEAFAVIREGMKGKAGIGKVALYGREYLIKVQPRDRGLVMYTLRHASEIRSMDAIEELADMPETVKPAEVALARQVISTFEGAVDVADYRDDYQQGLREIIDAKIAGREIIAPEVQEPPKVVNLMEALRRSLDSISVGKKRPAQSDAAESSQKRAAAGKRRRSA
jgi:DNA end-binding protein Ku